MGAHLNGYTSREQTAYYIKALSKDMPKGRIASGQSLIWRLSKGVRLCFSPTSIRSNNRPGNEVVAKQ